MFISNAIETFTAIEPKAVILVLINLLLWAGIVFLLYKLSQFQLESFLHMGLSETTKIYGIKSQNNKKGLFLNEKLTITERSTYVDALFLLL